MLYVFVVRSFGKAVCARVLSEAERANMEPISYENRNDWKTFDAAKEVAAALGPEYIATDAGPHVSPRYDVQALPKVGQPCSYAFNGDSYPCGHIKSISAGPAYRLIVTDEGKKFYRVRNTGSWRADGTWFLVEGHHNKRNPEF